MLIRTFTYFTLVFGLTLGCVPEITPPGGSPDDTGSGPGTVVDADGDGYNSGEDCDDTDSAIFPGATEICDDVDNDCDDEIDEDVPTLYADDDGDGFGDPDGATTTACEADGFSPYGVDCDDTNDGIHPGVEDLCDGLDNDCDDVIDEDEATTVSQEDDEADYSTINGALTRGADCISVGPGTYYETLVLEYDVIITSSEGPETTTISGAYDEASVVVFETGLTNATVLDGFTIRDGKGTEVDEGYFWGGGLYVNYATPTLRNLIVSANKPSSTSGYTYGGGAYFRPDTDGDEALILEDIEFSENQATTGADFYLYANSADSTFRRIWAHDSYSTSQGGSIYVSSGYNGTNTVFENVIVSGFTQQTNSTGVVQLYYVHADLTNVAVVDSSALSAMYIYDPYGTYSDVEISNSVLAYNDATYAFYVYNATATVASVNVAYTAVHEPTTMYDSANLVDFENETNLIGEDPEFVSFTQDEDGSNDKLALQKGSPLIDAGDPSTEYNDLDGSRNDIGPYGGPEATW